MQDELLQDEARIAQNAIQGIKVGVEQIKTRQNQKTSIHDKILKFQAESKKQAVNSEKTKGPKVRLPGPVR